jgi:hypothetical protein
VTSESDLDHAGLELARRLLTSVPFGPAVELVVGGLPPDLVDALPLPAGARLLGSALSSRETRSSTLEAVFDAAGDPAPVLAGYQRQLQDLGWEMFEAGPGRSHGGFVPRRGDERIMLRHGGRGPVLRAVAVAGSGQSVDLRVTLDWEMPRHLAEWRAPRDPGEGRMPSLYPPPGVIVHPQGGGGGGGRWRQEAIAETDLTAGELEAHFAAQLAQAAWTRLDGRLEDAVAWSSWQLPGDGDWRGLLFVLALFGTRRRSLWIGIESAGPDEGSGGYATSQVVGRS